jgi:hypothetical protein
LIITLGFNQGESALLRTFGIAIPFGNSDNVPREVISQADQMTTEHGSHSLGPGSSGA